MLISGDSLAGVFVAVRVIGTATKNRADDD